MNESEKMTALRMQQIANSVAACLPTNEQMTVSMQAAIAPLLKAMDFDNQAVNESARAAILELQKTMLKMKPETWVKVSEVFIEVFRSVSLDYEIPVKKAEAVVEEVKPYLPPEAAERVEAKIKEAKTSDNKMSRDEWLQIVAIIVSVLLSFAEWAGSLEHDRKEEDFWASTVEYQHESLEIQRKELELKQEILECFQNLQGSAAGVSEGSECVGNDDQCIADPVDPQDVVKDSDTLQEQANIED